MSIFHCERCGQQFERHLSPSHLQRNPPRFCSRSCAQPNRPSRVTLTCVQCSRTFQRKAYMREWSQERGPFCGFRCYGAWQSEHSTGEANPWFRPQSNRRGAGQWERNRAAALERDRYQCVRCHSVDRLHVHHKAPWQPEQPDPHALDNLETLCASCHRRSHPMKHAPDGRFVARSR